MMSIVAGNIGALYEHLKCNPDFYAGLDVYENEPVINRELLALSNVLCLPHIGSASGAARSNMAEICLNEALRFAKGLPLQYEYKL